MLEQQPDQAGLTERYVHEAVRFLREPSDRPFFLYLAHLYVHLPIYVQERFARQSANGPYGAAVEAIDWTAAVLLRELDRLGLTDDTIVIFTSDNGSLADGGGGSNLPLRGVKGTTWEGGLRVPCIVRWPGRIAAGRVSNEVVTAMDLFPTLAANCGAQMPTDRTIDGRDVSDVWFDETARSPHEAFFYYRQNDLEAVRCGRWKLRFWDRRALGRREAAAAVAAGELHRVLDPEMVAVRELYDLVEDEGETTDVYDRVSVEQPEVIELLDRHAERARESLGDASTGRVGNDVRPIGRLEVGRTLTTFDPDRPYYMAEYDLPDRG